MWNVRNSEYSLLKLDTYPIKKPLSSKVSFPQNSYKLYINFSINMGWEMCKIDDAFIFNNSLKRHEEKLIIILLHWNVNNC